MSRDDADAKTYPTDGGSDGDAPPAGVLRPGDVIGGKYRVDRVIGMGGMGVVVAATHLDLGEVYAIKCLLPQGAKNPEAVERFMREARAAVRTKSEHIARVSDVGKLPDGAPFIVMEYLTGTDLSDLLSNHGPVSIRDAVEYVLQACTGIAEAHALGIVHRDLKPSNLFLTQRLDGAPLVKVLDFGISKAIDDGAHNPSLTQTASVFGSPAYMSPEQVRSAKNVDYRTDVWALGVILHELLTGELPFVAETASGLLAAIAADEPELLRQRRPDASPELEAIVRRCLEKNVKNRYQSVSELAVALEPFSGDGSLVSVGRIRRLSAGPPMPLRQSDPQVHAQPTPPFAHAHAHPTPPAYAHAHATPPYAHATPPFAREPERPRAGVFTATEKAWTSTDLAPRRGRAVVAAVVAVALAGAAAAGVWLYAVQAGEAARTKRASASESTVAPPSAEAPPGEATPAGAARPPATIVSGSVPASSPASSASPALSATIEPPAAAVASPPHIRPGVAPPRAVPPPPAKSAAPAASTSSPPTLPSPGARRLDPTAESH